MTIVEQPSEKSLVEFTQVTVDVKNPADANRVWNGLFSVDTRAVDSVVPSSRLEEIGISPEIERTYAMNDGTKKKLRAGIARLEFLGDIVGTTVIFGPEDMQPILGTTALASAGIVVDPKSNQLKRLPAVPLKTVQHAK